MLFHTYNDCGRTYTAHKRTNHLQVFVAEADSVDAQHEALQLVVDTLKRMGRLQQDGTTIRVRVGSAWHTWDMDAYRACPLELAARIVQEDLVIMRPPQEGQPPRYAMAAAAVVFSFGELEAKLGAGMPMIHAPVPGFESDLDKLLTKTFDKLQPDKPGTAGAVLATHVTPATTPTVWRVNWGLAPSAALDDPLYGFGGGVSAAVPMAERFLKTEYQTLRRMQRTGTILFTVRTFVEPLAVVPPEARRTLAASARGMSPSMLVYKGIASAEAEVGVALGELLRVLEC